MEKITVSARLEPGEYAKLQRFAKQRRWSLSTAIRYLVGTIEDDDEQEGR